MVLRSTGGATALIAGIAKPLPRWAGFVFVPAVALSSVRACPYCLLTCEKQVCPVAGTLRCVVVDQKLNPSAWSRKVTSHAGDHVMCGADREQPASQAALPYVLDRQPLSLCAPVQMRDFSPAAAGISEGGTQCCTGVWPSLLR